MIAIDRYTVECEFTRADLDLMAQALNEFGEAMREAAPTDYDTPQEYERDQELAIRALALALRVEKMSNPEH